MENNTCGKMPQLSYGRRMLHIWLPFLIYWFSSMIVHGVVLTVVYMRDITANEQQYLEAMENQEAMMNMAYDLLGRVMQYSTEIQAAGALILIPIMLWMYRRDRKKEAYYGVKQNKKAAPSKYIWIVVLSAGLNVALNNVMNLVKLSQYSEGYQTTSKALYSSPFAMQLLCLGLIVPIAEELVFRGLMYRRMRQDTGMVPAMLYMAVVFGIVHGNLIQMLYGMVMGFVLCYLCEKYGTVIAPIFAHIVTNVIAVVLTQLDLYNKMLENIVVAALTTGVCSAMAAIAFLQIRKIMENPDSENAVANIGEI